MAHPYLRKPRAAELGAMYGFLDCWKSTARRYRWLLVLWLAAAVGLATGRVIPLPILLLQLPLILAFLSADRARKVWRFWHRLMDFEEASGRYIEFRYAPELKDQLDVSGHLEHWDRAVEDLTVELGLSLPTRPRVYLFPTVEELDSFLERGVSGFAVYSPQAVLVALNGLAPDQHSMEHMRHELAHLFAARWGKSAPPLKGEGWATWVQGSAGGRPTDFHALAILLVGTPVSLPRLLEGSVFWADGAASYMLAGSFTGFLIRHWGRDGYRQWYRKAEPRTYEEEFQKHFGTSLEAAEREWREELLAQRGEFEPDLTWEVCRRRAGRAFDEERMSEALEGIETLRQADQATAWDLELGAGCHISLGNHAQAVSFLLRSLETRDALERLCDESRIWLQVGMLYERLDDLAEAERAYQECLNGLDVFYSKDEWVHARARRQLNRLRAERELRDATGGM